MDAITRSGQRIPRVIELRRLIVELTVDGRAPSVIAFDAGRPEGWASAVNIINHYNCSVPRGEAHSWAKLLGTLGLKYDPERKSIEVERIMRGKQRTEAGQMFLR